MSPADLLVPGPLHALAALLLAVALLRRARAPRWLGAAVGLWALLTWMLATPALGNLAARVLEDAHPPPALHLLPREERTTIVVLASGQMFRADGTPEPLLDENGWARLRAATRLWQQVGGQLVVAGGPGRGAGDSLAGAMRVALIEAGVPAARVTTVGGSRNTYEDLLAASRVLGPPAGPRWLVTSAIHMPRAAGVAQALDLQLEPFPCDHRQLQAPSWRAWIPGNAAPVLWRDALHEGIGLVVYRWRGWIR